MDYTAIDCVMLGIITLISLADFYFTLLNNKKHVKKLLKKFKKSKPRNRRIKPPLKIVVGGSNQ